MEVTIKNRPDAHYTPRRVFTDVKQAKQYAIKRGIDTVYKQTDVPNLTFYVV